jgi:hypothetical protein
MTLGKRVRRIAGGAGYYGNEGTVVETNPDTGRIRVLWTHRAVYNYTGTKINYTGELREIRDPLRTWVRQTAVIELVDKNTSGMV